jgi:hypothetical protein
LYCYSGVCRMKNKDYYDLNCLHVCIVDNKFKIQSRGLELLYVAEYDGQNIIDMFTSWLEQECSILSESERRVLKQVLEPFDVKAIKKSMGRNYGQGYLEVESAYPVQDTWTLPKFRVDESFKKLKLGQQYTLGDLGIYYDK